MLEDLKVLNGDMTLDFDPLNTIYTIYVKSDVEVLDLEYKVADEVNISIKGNELKNDLSEVVISVYKDEESTSYYLYVYKEDSIQTMLSMDNYETTEVEEINEYVAPVIASICFLIILFTFALLFGRKGSKK